MHDRDLDRLAGLTARVGKRLRRELDKQHRTEQRLARAISTRRILALPNVVGAGVGAETRRGKPTGVIGPIVFVSRKVRASNLKTSQRIPRTVRVAGAEHHVDVEVLRDPTPTCGLGVPDSQRRPHDPIPPDVQFGGHDPSDGLLMNTFTGAAIVRRRNDTSPNPPLYLLTAKHALENVITYTVSQPAGGRFVGGHVVSSANIDAALAEIHNPQAASHCFGPIAGTVPPLTGMKVKKSGGRTGVTGTRIRGVAHLWWFGALNRMIITDDANGVVPFAPYHDKGDSGSLSMAGAADDANDFGDPVNRLIDLIATAAGPANQRLVRWLLTSLLRSSAVGLNVGEASFGRFTLSHPIDDVLADLGVALA